MDFVLAIFVTGHPPISPFHSSPFLSLGCSVTASPLSPPQTNQRRFHVELPSVTAQLVVLLPRDTRPPVPRMLKPADPRPFPCPHSPHCSYMYKSFLFSHPRGKVERVSDRDPGVRGRGGGMHAA